MNISGVNIDFFKNLFFPITCCNCECFVDAGGLCSDCWSKMTWISEPKCQICGQPFVFEVDAICLQCASCAPYFDKAISVFVYDEFSKKMILKFKHFDGTYLSEPFVNWMYKSAILDVDRADLIIPVPIHFWKRLKRKYNQSELLAKGISDISGVKYEPRILKKIKQTSPQEGLSGKSRRKNVVGSFGTDEKYGNLVKDKHILLVDDVFTTGSTANECSRILKRRGASRVTVLTLARTAI